MSATLDRLSVAFLSIADLCIALGEHPLTKHLNCWERQVDERWWIAVNGHAEPRTTSEGTELKPFHAYITYNGWPAAILTPTNGTFVSGDGANEDTFIAAVRAATERVEAPHAK